MTDTTKKNTWIRRWSVTIAFVVLVGMTGYTTTRSVQESNKLNRQQAQIAQVVSQITEIVNANSAEITANVQTDCSLRADGRTSVRAVLLEIIDEFPESATTDKIVVDINRIIPPIVCPTPGE